MRNRLGLLYGILVVLLLAIGVWWVYFLSHEGRLYEEYRLQQLDSNRLHASFLIQADPAIATDPARRLGPSFPHLVFRRGADGWQALVDPAVVETIRDEARRKRNMIIAEGLVFLLALAAGSTILVLSVRSETRFKQARELFLAGATHELKTPLASLRLAAETLGRDDLRQEDRTRLRDNLVVDVTRLEGLVDELLAMSAESTVDGVRRERVDLVAASRHVLEDLERYRGDHEAEFAFRGDEGARILGSPQTFDLALRNLLLNAVRHCPAPVRVEVTVKRGGRWHRVSVRDDGPGIPRRLHEKVFECFYSGDGASPGAGLGLHLVRRNVAQLGGRVELDSDPGAGSNFTMILPAAGAG
ncbi:MAG: HAMP domain-containing histidine kinase [bacterium]|nr:HAMP domain-containing histidine kinase [bacterium]